MQILLRIPEDLVPEANSISPELMDRINEDYGIRKADDVRLVNIGTGADWMAYLAIFNVAWTLFQLPGIVKNSVEGWQWIVELIKTTISKKQLISLDIDAAGLLAVDYLHEKYSDNSAIRLMDMHTFNIIDISGMIRNDKETHAFNPHNYYVFTFSTSRKVFVLGVRSTGDIKELEVFNTTSGGFLDSNDFSSAFNYSNIDEI